MAADEKQKYLSVGYTAWDLLSDVMGAAEPDSVQANTTEYLELLNTIRERISNDHANTLNNILTNPNAHNVLMPIILSYVTDYVNNTNDLTININKTAARVFQDMAGFGILTPYLNDPTVEEININAWNSIDVLWSNRTEMLKDTFSSPEECKDIIRKMVRIGGKHIDFSQPIIDSFIGDGTRISASLPPVVPDTVGAMASIRKQTFKKVTKENYLALGFCTEEVWDFMEMAIKSNVSLGIAGSPGAGKTTLMTCLLRDFMHDPRIDNNRISIIEEAREIELTETEELNPYGGHPRMVSRNLQMATTSGENPVNARALIRHSLRLNPQIIVPAEMRGAEASEAVEAGLTGVQIVSSFHAWGAKDGYMRILSMCMMGGGSASENTLMDQIRRAFPIMIFIKKDEDGVRRVHEIFQATGVKNGRIQGNTIYKFVRTRVTENTDGRILKIEGKFLQIDSISRDFRQHLLQHGARRKIIDRYFFEGESPDKPNEYLQRDVEVITVEEMTPVEDRKPHIPAPAPNPADVEPPAFFAAPPASAPRKPEPPVTMTPPAEPEIELVFDDTELQPVQTNPAAPPQRRRLFDNEAPNREVPPVETPASETVPKKTAVSTIIADPPPIFFDDEDLSSPEPPLSPKEENRMNDRRHREWPHEDREPRQFERRNQPQSVIPECDTHSAFNDGEKEDLMPIPKGKGFWGGNRNKKGGDSR